MKFLLDTNTCIVYLNQRNSMVQQQMVAHTTENITLCTVVKAELFYGAYRSLYIAQNLRTLTAFFARFACLPFDDAAAEKFGQVRAQLARLGTPIGPNDLMIASIALAHSLTLVTHNTREFSRITGLALEDWETHSSNP